MILKSFFFVVNLIKVDGFILNWEKLRKLLQFKIILVYFEKKYFYFVYN